MQEKTLAEIETVVMEYAGPMGRFVVRKQIKDLGRPYETLTEPEKKEFIRRIASLAIFNTDMQKVCVQRLSVLLIGKAFI